MGLLGLAIVGSFSDIRDHVGLVGFVPYRILFTRSLFIGAQTYSFQPDLILSLPQAYRRGAPSARRKQVADNLVAFCINMRISTDAKYRIFSPNRVLQIALRIDFTISASGRRQQLHGERIAHCANVLQFARNVRWDQVRQQG
jgi:hypothetical protein